MASWDRQSIHLATQPQPTPEYIHVLHDNDSIIYGYETDTEPQMANLRVSLGHIYEDLPHSYNYRRQSQHYAAPSDISMYSTTTSETLLVNEPSLSSSLTAARPAQPIPVDPVKKFPFINIPKKCQWALWSCLVLVLIVLTGLITAAVLAPGEDPVEAVELNMRITCTPDMRGDEARSVTEEECRRRGCAFSQDGLPELVDQLGPPVCYMGPRKISYRMDNPAPYQPGNWDNIAVLTANHEPIPFDPHRAAENENRVFKTPAFRSAYLSENTLRFQLFDKEDSDRYEVPVELHDVRTNFNESGLKYTINITNKNPFTFRVSRKRFGSEVVLLDTSIGGLVLQDQFLQFSTKLPSEHLFGLGDNRLDSLKRTMDWSTCAMFNRDVDLPLLLMGLDTQSIKSKNLYGSQPFYMVIEDDGKAHGVFLRNSNAMDYTLQPGNAITWRTIGGILDFYVFFGPTPENVVQQFTKLTGRTFMPPYWALGFQIGRWGMKSAEETRELAQRNRNQNIPFDAVFVDSDYMDERQPFTVNQTGANFLNLTTEMRDTLGIHYSGVIFPSVHADANGSGRDPYNTAVQKGILVKWPENFLRYATTKNPQSVGENSVMLGKAWANGRSAWVDYLNPDSEEWLTEMLRLQDAEQASLSALWLGSAEPSSFATNQDAKEAWFIKGRSSDNETNYASIPGFGKHAEYTLKCDPESLYERPPYKTAAIREWEGQIRSYDVGSGHQLSNQTLCMDAVQIMENRTKPFKHYDVHNIYGLTIARTAYRSARKVRSTRTLIMAKASFPGIQQYAGRWLGDVLSEARDFHYSFQWMLEYSILGNSYTGVDVCGFWGPEFYSDRNLLMALCHRWTIAGIFYPLMRAHSANTNDPHDPARMFEGKPAFLQEVRNALNLRYRLLPYLYTLFHIAHTRGDTVVRPLHHVYTNNLNIINYVNAKRKQIQFFWGPALMITPVLEVQADTAFIQRMDITFPPDIFYDFFTGEMINREDSKHEPEAYNLTGVSVGLHGRAGTIIMTQAVNGQLSTRESHKNNFTIVVFPKKDQFAYGEFFWDDGESLDTYETGHYFNATMRYKGEDSIVFPLLPFGFWHALIFEVEHNNYTEMDNYFIEKIQIYGTQTLKHQRVIIDGVFNRSKEFTFSNEEPDKKIMSIVGPIPMNRNFTFLFTNDNISPEEMDDSAEYRPASSWFMPVKRKE